MNKKGFTLIELLVVIAIIGVLAGFLMANFVGVRQRARDGVRKSDLRQIQAALELYRSDNGAYPTIALACPGAITNGTTVYMQKIPCDPTDSSAYPYSSSAGVTYTLVACLENGNDSQKDSTVNSACSSRTGISYTLQNP